MSSLDRATDVHDPAADDTAAGSQVIIRCHLASRFFPFVGRTDDLRAKRDEARLFTPREAAAWISRQTDPSEWTAESPAPGTDDGAYGVPPKRAGALRVVALIEPGSAPAHVLEGGPIILGNTTHRPRRPIDY